MIVVNLKGGLGNQMFQYACGRAISIKCDQPMLLSKEYLDFPDGRKYGLAVFNIKSPLASPEERDRIKYPLGIISKGWRFFAGKFLKQFRTIAFDEKVTKCRKNLFLDGYFQTEKYFKDYEKEIREDFTLKDPLSESAQKIADEIKKSENPVSIHFRRTDYVGHTNFDINDPEYHTRARKIVEERSRSPKYFVFSDDIKWVKENVGLPEGSIYVSSPDKISDQEELMLMSICRHNIIMNSSFSWWGAWLNNNPDKIVVAPKTWNKEQWRFKDTIPENWIQV